MLPTSLRYTTMRLVATPTLRLQTPSRHLSTQTSQAVSKLQAVFEEYRKVHYAQCLPSRFKKDLVRAATAEESNMVVHQSMNEVLHNIGAADRLSAQEVQLIFQEIGSGDGISANEFLKLL